MLPFVVVGVVMLIFAVNAFVMEKYQKKHPKIFIIANKEPEYLAIITLMALSIISILAIILITSNILNDAIDAIAVLVIFTLFVMTLLSPVLFLANSISHILKRTETFLMFILRVISIAIAIAIVYTGRHTPCTAGFEAVFVVMMSYARASCALLVIGTFIPEMLYLSSLKIRKNN